MAGKTQLTLEEGSEAIITRGGLQVTFGAAGGVAVTVNGKNIVVDQTGKLTIGESPAGGSKKTKKTKVLEVGDRREDGWAYVGVDNGQNIFAKSCGVKKWKEAMAFAAGQNAHLGSDAELDLLQTVLNKGYLRNSFNVGGSDLSGWVWGVRRSPNVPDGDSRVHKLGYGLRGWRWQDKKASVVLFRSEPISPGPE